MKIKEINPRVPIISNSRALIYLLTEKVAYALPNRFDSQTAGQNPAYTWEMVQTKELLHEGAIIAFFPVFATRNEVLPAENYFETELELHKLAVTPDGYLFALQSTNP